MHSPTILLKKDVDLNEVAYESEAIEDHPEEDEVI